MQNWTFSILRSIRKVWKMLDHELHIKNNSLISISMAMIILSFISYLFYNLYKTLNNSLKTVQWLTISWNAKNNQQFEESTFFRFNFWYFTVFGEGEMHQLWYAPWKLPCNFNCRFRTVANLCLSILEREKDTFSFGIVVASRRWLSDVWHWMGMLKAMPGVDCKSVTNSLCDVLPMYS